MVYKYVKKLQRELNGWRLFNIIFFKSSVLGKSSSLTLSNNPKISSIVKYMGNFLSILGLKRFRLSLIFCVYKNFSKDLKQEILRAIELLSILL